MARHYHVDGVDWLVTYRGYVRGVGPLPNGHYLASHPASGRKVRSDSWSELQHLLWAESQVIHADLR